MEGARAEAGRTIRRPLKKSRTRWTRTVVGRGVRMDSAATQEVKSARLVD